jgi:hypothetical protein
MDFSNQTSEAEVAAEIQRRNAAREAARRDQLERDAAFRAQRSPEQVDAEQRREFADLQRQLDYARANPYSPATERFFRENPTRRSESAIQMPDWDGAGMSSPEVNQPNPLSQSPTVTPAPVVPTVPVQPLAVPGPSALPGGQSMADALNLATTMTPGQTGDSLRPEQEELIRNTRARDLIGVSPSEFRGLIIGEAANIAGVSVEQLNDPAFQATLNMRNLLERASAKVSRNYYQKD